mgnify:CR=1 FL=1
MQDTIKSGLTLPTIESVLLGLQDYLLLQMENQSSW